MVILTVSNEAGTSSQSATINVTGYSRPNASFVPSTTTGQAPLNVDFADSSSGIITDFWWDFGDGLTSTSQNPTHVYSSPGTYTPTLTVSGPGGISDPATVSVTLTPPPPVAAFSAAPTSGSAPLPVQFTDLTANTVTEWSWDFGDGQTSTLQNPSHTYTNPGSYSVCLSVNGAEGADSVTLVNHVNVSNPGVWPNRIAFRINNAKVDSDLIDFPILLNIDGSLSPGLNDVFTQLYSDANRTKIKVTTDDEVTQCYVEIERWDTASRMAQLHVRVPAISHSAPATLYLYYDPSQPDNTDYVGDTGSAAAANVWDTDFIGVWHMSQNPGAGGSCILDSTRNGLHGTPYNMNSQNLQDTRIDFNGTNQRISCGINPAFQPSNTVTVESLLTADAITASRLIAQYGKAYGQSYGLSLGAISYNSAQLEFGFYNGAWRMVSDPDPYPTEAPVYGAGRYNGSVLSVFTNGVLKNSAEYTGSFDYSYLGGFTIGAYYLSSGFTNFLDGKVGEVRVSKTSRSDAWVPTSHNI